MRVFLDAAVTTNQLIVYASYTEHNVTSGSEDYARAIKAVATTSGATPVTLVGSPGTTITREINALYTYNRDTAPRTLTIRYYDGTTNVDLPFTLLPNARLSYSRPARWEIANNEQVLTLSGSTNGRAILVAATATAGTLLHTAIAGTLAYDYLDLFVTNTDSTDRTLTLEYGGTTNPNDLVYNAVTIPARTAMFPIVVGLPLNGGVVVRAFASAANLLTVTGKVLRKVA